MKFTEQLRAIDDADLDPYQFRLVMHIWRVGNCWESVRTTAQKCKMSVGKVSQAISELLQLNIIERVAVNGKMVLRVCSSDEQRSPHEQIQQLNGSNRSPHEHQRSPHEQKRSCSEQGEKSLPLEKCSPHELKINRPNEVRPIEENIYIAPLPDAMVAMIAALTKATKTKYGAGFNEDKFEQAAAIMLRDGVTIEQVESFPGYWRDLGWGGNRGLPTLEKVVEEMDNCIRRVDTRPKLSPNGNGRHEKPVTIDPLMPKPGQGGVY